MKHPFERTFLTNLKIVDEAGIRTTRHLGRNLLFTRFIGFIFSNSYRIEKSAV
jgi:hypothetical protein